MPKWLFYTLISIVFWAAWGVVSKVSSTTASALHTQVLFTVGLVPPVLLALPALARQRRDIKPRGIAYGFLTGLIGGIGNLTLFYAFERGGKAAIVSPMTGLYPLFTVLAALIMLRERLNRVQVAGIGLAGISIYLLSGG